MGNEQSAPNRRVQTRVVVQQRYQQNNEDEMLGKVLKINSKIEAEAFGNMLLRAYVADHLQRQIEQQERENQLQQVRIALRTKNENGNTPLHLAVAKGDNEAVAQFIMLGADVNVTDNDGDGALNIALIRVSPFQFLQI